MTYLLDTDVIINHLRGTEQLPEEIYKNEIYISIITYAELIYGAQKSHTPEKTRQTVLDFLEHIPCKILNLDNETIFTYASIKASLEKKGMPLDDFDLLIASTALENDCTLLTKNTKHFKRIPDLLIKK